MLLHPARRTLLLFYGLLIALFFLVTWTKQSFLFDSDDLMNLHEAYTAPPARLLHALLLPFSTFNRPTGALYYRLCFDLFGWNPAAFRIVTYCFMALNLGLICRLATLLTGSLEIGAAAALLYSFHAHLRPLYISNGTVYDVLCAFFLLLTLIFYIQVRRRGIAWSSWRLLILVALYIAALNAKEMAAILPFVLLIFEWLRDRSSMREKARACLPALALLALTCLALLGKTRPGGPFHAQPFYSVSFTIKRFFQNQRTFHSELFYLNGRVLKGQHVVAIWLCLLLLPAWMPRITRRPLWVCCAIAILGPLPVVFIPGRAFYVMYIPLIGWTIYVATLAVSARKKMFPNASVISQLALPLAIAVVMLQGLRDPLFTMPSVDPTRALIVDTRSDLLALDAPLVRGSRNLLLHSRFPDTAWAPLMMMRLLYRDPTLWLDRPTVPLTGIPSATEMAAYDCVFDFNGARLVVVMRHAPSGPLLYPR